ncbi:MAG: hypothetical protein ACPHY8_01950 [Patescibacteria group bacterium]
MSKDGNAFEYIANTDYNNINLDSISKEYTQVPHANILDNTQSNVEETPFGDYQAVPIDEQPIPGNPDPSVPGP